MNCQRCNCDWHDRDFHTTVYSWANHSGGLSDEQVDETYSIASGVSPLCEPCWLELETPEARLPFYRKLSDMWWEEARNIQDEGQIAEMWPMIEKNVLSEVDRDSILMVKIGTQIWDKYRELPARVCNVYKYSIEARYLDKRYGIIGVIKTKVREEFTLIGERHAN